MKKYIINQEIPVPPPMQEPGDTGSPLEHMLSSIDHQHEFSEEDRRLTAQIEAVRLLVTKLEIFATSIDAISLLTNHLEEQTNKLKAMVIPAKLTHQSKQELEKYINDLIEQEKVMLESHRRQQRQEWEGTSKLFKSIIRDNKGIWLSNKVFWWAIGIFELAVCLAIYFGGNALVTVFQ